MLHQGILIRLDQRIPACFDKVHIDPNSAKHLTLKAMFKIDPYLCRSLFSAVNHLDAEVREMQVFDDRVLINQRFL